MIETTLVFPLRPDQVCLGYKTSGFGVGKWNGFGGKIEAEESPSGNAVRELREETGIRANEVDLRWVAEHTFYQGGGAGVDIHMYVYTLICTKAEPREVEKMRPEWFAFDAIPYGEMWVDDILWLPRVLSGERLRGEFWFDEAGERIRGHTLKPLELRDFE